MLLKARWIVPVSSPPIENGVVVVVRDRIAFVGKDLPLAPSLVRRGWGEVDLGDAALLPGLVNAHCHLEFSHLKGKTMASTASEGLPTPGKSFTEWVREMSRTGDKKTVPPEPLQRLLETGSTTVADHCNPDIPAFETAFRRIPLWEVLGAEKKRAEASYERARDRVASEGGFATPHSSYAVHQDILKEMTSPLAPLLSIHLLESAHEEAFFRQGSGPLAEYVRELGGDVPAPASPLERLPPRTVIVHGNYLNPAEIGSLRGLEASVIHCPGSHRFFGHKRFPYEELRAAGVRVALGTDSLASNEDLSMLREMRLFRDTYPDVGVDEILRMATLEGAAALGMDREIGSIEVGKKADLIAVRGRNVLEAESVIFSMIDGKTTLTP